MKEIAEIVFVGSVLVGACALFAGFVLALTIGPYAVLGWFILKAAELLK